MKIIDTFLFSIEYDILDIRLNILNDYVDYFLIGESNLSFSGIEKSRNFLNNKHLYEKFNKKIKYVNIDLIPATETELEKIKNNDEESLQYHQVCSYGREAIARNSLIQKIGLSF